MVENELLCEQGAGKGIGSGKPFLFPFLFKKDIYLFIWLHRVLVVACTLLVAASGI